VGCTAGIELVPSTYDYIFVMTECSPLWSVLALLNGDSRNVNDTIGEFMISKIQPKVLSVILHDNSISARG
jgi:hypothetical protein